MIPMRNVPHFQFNKITCSKLAIDGQIKQSQFPDLPIQLKTNPNGPDVFQLEWRLLSCQFSFVPWFMMIYGNIGFHDSISLRKVEYHFARYWDRKSSGISSNAGRCTETKIAELLD